MIFARWERGKKRDGSAICAQRVSCLACPDYGVSGGEGQRMRKETEEVGWAQTIEPRKPCQGVWTLSHGQ